MCGRTRRSSPASGIGRSYGDFFRAVREVNASLAPARRLRVLLGDPPVDWDLVRRIDEGPASGRMGMVRINGIWIEKAQEATLDRDAHAAQLVIREVVARRRRALLVFGDGHLRRGVRGLVTRLEEAAPVKVFTHRERGRPSLRVARGRTPRYRIVAGAAPAASDQGRSRPDRRRLRRRPASGATGGDDVVAYHCDDLRRRCLMCGCARSGWRGPGCRPSVRRNCWRGIAPRPDDTPTPDDSGVVRPRTAAADRRAARAAARPRRRAR